MLFTSYAFIGFLAVALIAYYAVPKKLQWITLLATSYVFYAFAGLDCLVFILFTTVSSYVISRLMVKNKTAEDAYIEENRETLSKDEKKKYRASEKKKDSAYSCSVFCSTSVFLPCSNIRRLR